MNIIRKNLGRNKYNLHNYFLTLANASITSSFQDLLRIRYDGIIRLCVWGMPINDWITTLRLQGSSPPCVLLYMTHQNTHTDVCLCVVGNFTFKCKTVYSMAAPAPEYFVCELRRVKIVYLIEIKMSNENIQKDHQLSNFLTTCLVRKFTHSLN